MVLMNRLFSFAFILLFFGMIGLFAQLQIDPLFEDWESLVLFVPVAIGFIITQLVKVGIELNDTWKKVLSWILPIVATFVAAWLNWGYFAELLWWKLLIVGGVSALVANGLFDTAIGQFILALLGIGQNKDKYNKTKQVESRFPKK